MALFTVRGLTELKAALKEMNAQAPRELAKADKKVGNIVAREAIRLAPRGKHEGSGQVISIAHSIYAVLSANKVAIVAGGPKAPHAAGAEFGGYIPRRGLKGKKAYAKKVALLYGGHTVTRLKRQPYMLPAINAKLPDVLIAYERMLDELVARFRRR